MTYIFPKRKLNIPTIRYYPYKLTYVPIKGDKCTHTERQSNQSTDEMIAIKILPPAEGLSCFTFLRKVFSPKTSTTSLIDFWHLTFHQRTNGPMVPWSHSLIVQWSIGLMDQWTNEPMDQWTNGTMDQCSTGPTDRWTSGPMDQWTDGTMDQLNNGPLDQWNNGPMYQW